MAFSLGGKNSGRSRFHGTEALSEINVVPLVDVVLVLLIIFMLTAHVMEVGLQVEVPKVKQVTASVEDLPIVTINRAGAFALNEDRNVNLHQLADQIHQRFPNAKGVYLRADKAASWDPIAQVIAELGHAQFEVKVVIEPIEQPNQRNR